MSRANTAYRLIGTLTKKKGGRRQGMGANGRRFRPGFTKGKGNPAGWAMRGMAHNRGI